MPDEPVDSAPDVQADHRQLRRLSGTGLAADDDDLVVSNGRRDFLAPPGDRQRLVQRDFRNTRRTCLPLFGRLIDRRLKLLQVLVERLLLPLSPPDRIQRPAQPKPVAKHRLVNLVQNLPKIRLVGHGLAFVTRVKPRVVQKT